MELNITRSMVCTNDTCINQNIEHGVDFDVNIPDYCGEVHKILRSSLVPRVSSKSVSGQTLVIEGNACYSVVFLDGGNQIHCFEEVVSFSKSLDLGADFECSSITAHAKCGYLNARAVNQHRISVHSVVDMHIRGLCKKSAEIISDIDDPNVFINRGDTPTTLPINCVEKNIIIEEELEVGAGQCSIDSVLRYDVMPTIISHKMINDKIIVKGELSADILYLCADEKCRTEKYSATIPFSQIIDIEGVTEDCECEIIPSVAFLEVKPRSAYDGGSRSFILNAKICLCASAVCNNDVSVIYDAYSPKYNLNLKNTNTQFQKVVDKITDNYMCRKKLEFSDGDIKNVIDMWCTCASKGYRLEENNVIISGTVTVSMFAENSSDEINYFERPIDFEYKTALNSMPENLRCEPTITCGSVSYTLAGDDCIEVSVSLSVSAAISEVKQISVLTEAELLECDSCKPCNECSLVIYFATKGENVWDIAKKYNASPEEIMQINSLGDKVDVDKTILISC